ncbi:hypothetical protein HDU90_003148 [Geranomyces variabilis]|nr:hypothetical protein HDU90_003148 [Geranomyces variabilis]
MLNNTPPLRTCLSPPSTAFTVETHLTAPLRPHKAIRRLANLSILHTLAPPTPQHAQQPDNESDDDALSKPLAEFFQSAPGGSAYERYLTHLSTHSRILSLALQLRADVTHTHYPNTAHLLALLYESLFCVPRLLGFQARIAARFEEIKAAIKAKIENADTDVGVAVIDGGLNEWLFALTTDIVQETLYYRVQDSFSSTTTPTDLIPEILARALRQ